MIIKSRINYLVLLSCFWEVYGMAAPSLPVSKPFVSPGLSLTGPENDAYAGQGQWFKRLSDNRLENRTHEFYDNTTNTGGGVMGTMAISGVVMNVQSVSFPFPGISAFDVLVTIYNDSSTSGGGPWTNGINSHNETLNTQEQYTNTLNQIIISADFATCGNIAANADKDPAYTDYAPYIVANNNDYSCWFGTTAVNANQMGDYFVPGWDFGDLLPGQSTNRLLSFVVLNGSGFTDIIPNTDPRYSVLMNASVDLSDILINRTSSLKISNWIGSLSPDNGSDYPINETTSSFLENVSVFHNINSGSTSSNTPILIANFNYQPTPPSIILSSVGSSGVTMQILQSITDLASTNWSNIASNWAYPPPQTNYWTNAMSSESTFFFRIIQ